jgi:hypothetical protein
MVGFLLAAYSVVANDSVQTLGTFLASNSRHRWYVLWLGASVVLVATLVAGWMLNGGDISYGRLDSIPLPDAFGWPHAAAPLAQATAWRWSRRLPPGGD